MNRKQAEQEVARANRALTKAKIAHSETGAPIPEKLRVDLNKAIADLEYIQARDGNK